VDDLLFNSKRGTLTGPIVKFLHSDQIENFGVMFFYILTFHVRIRLMIAFHDFGFLGISCELEIFF
jgi:hypothetical protein